MSTANEKATKDVTIAEDGNIYEYDSSMVFTMGEGDAVNYIVNDGHYVVHAEEGGKDILSFQDTQPEDITWTYNNSYLTYGPSNNPYYLYYKSGNNYNRYRIKQSPSDLKGVAVYLFKEVPYVDYTVTFDVANGQWNDGTDATKEKEVSGPADEDLYLSDDDIPGVGENPTTHYGEGVWAPAIDTPITDENKSFTYSYSWLDHVYTEPKYTWNGYTGVEAERHCKFDGCSAKDEEQGHIESEVTKQPTCTDPGHTTYTATFTNPAFTTQTEVDETKPVATGHQLSDPTYAWTEYSSVKAEHHCTNEGCTFKEEEETTTISPEVTTPATCTQAGETTYTATFLNEAFKAQTVDKTAPAALGHEWGEATYSWSDDNRKATGTHKCTREGCGKEESEEVDTTVTYITEPTCEDPGEAKFTATFTKEKMSPTEKIVEVEALGHKWDAGTVVTPATTTTTGEMLHRCEREGCNASKTEVIPMIAKKANTLTAKGKTVKVKKNKLRKKTQNIKRTKAMTVSGAVGAVTYTKVSVGSKKINKKYGKKFKVNKTTGKVTVKKGKLKKGTYKVKINVTAAGNDEYSPATKTVTVKIKVR